ncbi:MFS transporter [Cellulomonas sp. Sa3CUA2]|uniref:MFS transporter n=1 Tax=Cellulomonas avistercoris TaxID=2762242 RepID=A0ABR8QEU3_9CELL|nr:MFS transporter [Cellulomonas avistercoris]MBD7918949.1 MFS transporter [Cellulomonas avistercoris]
MTTRALLPALAVCVLPFSIMQSAVSPLLGTFGERLGVDQAGTMWIFTAFLLSATVTTPVLGRLGDLHGKRRWMLIVVVVQVVGTVACAVAGDLATMLLGRALQGTGGALFPLAYGLLRDHLPPSRVALGIGVLSSVLGAGGSIGVVTAGPVERLLGPAWVFGLPGVLMAGSLLLIVGLVPESPQRGVGGLSWPSAVLLGAGLLASMLVLSTLGVWPVAVVGTIAVLGVVTMLAWARVEARATWPLVDVRLLRARGMWTTNLCSMLVGFALIQSFLVVPQLLLLPADSGFGFGVDVMHVGLYVLPSSLAMLAFSPVSGWLGGRAGARAPLIVGALLCATAYAALAFGHREIWAVVGANALNGIGAALAFSALPNLTVRAAPVDRTGVATAITTVARTAGGALGTQVAAVVLATATPVGASRPDEIGFTAVFAVMVVAMVGCLAVAMAVPRNPRPPCPPRPPLVVTQRRSTTCTWPGSSAMPSRRGVSPGPAAPAPNG